MSELKAIRGGDIHDDVEFTYNPDGENRADGLYYLKSEVDAEIRRLHRALYKACVEWMTNRQVALACFHLEARAQKFNKAIDKCLAKVEEYK